MSQPIITVENLSKAYRIGLKHEQPDTFAGALTGWIKAPLRNWKRLQNLNTSTLNPQPSTGNPPTDIPPTDILWALNNVSFEVTEGEVVGIIGRNGAGKSTLLKILSRITEPTSGRAVIRGRVSSLLEVGTGFHPELTGRENIYLNGTILGMRKKEIDRKLDEIIDFSGVEKFLDTPVKRYSSGMQVRLAFAVAAHLEPEILIIDEVLAVGDAEFQKKCLGKMQDVAQGGRTVLFVSHNMAAVQALCSRVLLLDEGELTDDTTPAKAILSYLSVVMNTDRERIWDDMQTAPGNEKVRVHRACVRPSLGSIEDPISIRTPITLEFDYWNLIPNARLNLSVLLLNEESVVVFNTGPFNERDWHGRPFPKGLFRDTCQIPGDLLNDGSHRIHLLIVEDKARIIFSDECMLSFDVADSIDRRCSNYHGRIIGAVRPNLSWSTELIEELTKVYNNV